MRALRYMGVRTTHFPTVTLAGLTCNLSMVDGTAFITNPSVDLTPYVGCKITLTDTSGYKAVGWIKAKGSAETLGDEKIDTWVNNGYDTLTLDGSDIDAAIEAGTNNALCYKDVSPTTGAMYKFVLGTLTITSGKTPTLGLCCTNSVSPASTDVFLNPAATGTYYVTSSLGGTSRYVGFRNSSGEANWSASGITFKQVTAPSATGVTITSSLDGATFNWFAKHSGFLPNAASFTAIIEG